MRYLLAILFFATSAMAAVEYDGTGDSHQINNPNAGATAFTVSFWLYCPTFDDDETLIGYGNGTDSSAGRGFSISTLTTGALRIDYWDGGTANNAFPSTTMSDATWYHVALVRVNTADNFLYVNATDGVADNDEAIDPPAAPNSTDDFWVAQDVPAATGFGRGNAACNITQVAYWNIALSGSEIQSIANKSTCPTAIQASNLKVFAEGDALPLVESAQALSVTTNGDPALVSDPSGLPCGGGGGGSGIIGNESLDAGLSANLNGGF